MGDVFKFVNRCYGLVVEMLVRGGSLVWLLLCKGLTEYYLANAIYALSRKYRFAIPDH